MSHISYNRQVILSRSASIESIIPENLEFNNFAVFCGNLERRLDTAIYALSRYAGEIGIVIIHDINEIENRIQHLSNRLNLSARIVRSSDSKIYDPLYGLSADAVVNLLAPLEINNPLSQNLHTLRSGILAYLKIMEYQFQKHTGPFGSYPYNLDLLIQLTSMPFERLKNTVLNYMPNHIADPIKTTLDVTDMQQNVYACVTNLATLMSEHLWQNRGFASHTGISIINSVSQNQIICIRIPNSHTDILNYIDSELKVLRNRNVPFLLVNCSINISNNPTMQKWFLDEHIGKNYYTSIVADSISHISTDPLERGKLFSQHQQIIVFNCAIADQAEPFSAQFGEYYRTEIEYSQGKVHQPFRIFSSHQQQTSERYIPERNVKIEDLIHRGNGILLCGSAYRYPILIDELI